MGKTYRKSMKGGSRNVTFPQEYFGAPNSQYFPDGSPNLVPHGYSTAYSAPNDTYSYFGNDLAPGTYHVPVSSFQTGGGKKYKKKDGGTILLPILNMAGQLLVPLAFFAGRKLLVDFTNPAEKPAIALVKEESVPLSSPSPPVVQEEIVLPTTVEVKADEPYYISNTEFGDETENPPPMKRSSAKRKSN